MMNWIVTLTRNNLRLTQRAIATFKAQDIGNVRILVVDNGSTDNTPQWLATQKDVVTIMNRPRKSVAAAWNQALTWLFEPKWANWNTPLPPMADYVLVMNNDVELRPDTMRRLVDDGGPFVTAVGTRDPVKISEPYGIPNPAQKRPHPDFSCFLIRREAWMKVGPFDENFKIAYVEDQDYHIRLHRAGITAECLDLPFLHLAAQTVTNANASDRHEITKQAEANRSYFNKKYGFAGGSEEYYREFGHGAPVPE